MNRPMEKNSIFSPGGNGLTGTVGTGAALGGGQLRDRDAGGDGRGRKRPARGGD